MNRVSNGLHDRLKKTAAISYLGQGMDVGDLNDYAHQISLYLLLKVFYREINDNHQRRKVDLIEMLRQIVKEMNLTASKGEIRRLVDGILYAGDPRQQANFSVMLYDEVERDFKEYKFRYLIPDRETSNWDQGGTTVYMLTEIAQEIIFITREVLQEFGFDLEQFYTLQLIKNGNFSNAKESVSNLIARVKNLIKQQKDWREDILRNPTLIFSARKEGNKAAKGELKEQFAEEKKVFAEMFSWRKRLDKFPTQQKKEGELLFEELERARSLHNRLAELAISNLSLELEIRKNNPEVFWKTAQVSFKKDFWQDIIVSSGLPEVELLSELLNPLFSPEQDFIFPLDWAWAKQQSYNYKLVVEDKQEEIVEEEPFSKELDWEQILDLWEAVFFELLEKGKYLLSSLNNSSSLEEQKWLAQEKNLELFMMFIITEIKLIVVEDEYPGLDERLLLFKRLIEKNSKFKELAGKKISATLEPSKPRVKLGTEFEIAPYTLYIQEE